MHRNAPTTAKPAETTVHPVILTQRAIAALTDAMELSKAAYERAGRLAAKSGARRA